jgi:CRISPR-associated protein Cmr3
MTAFPFQCIVLIEPLGMLYGSSGRLLSPEALTGQASEHFPPDSPAVAGLLASQLRRAEIEQLFTAGPFWWAGSDDLDLMLPAPMVLIQEEGGATGRQSRDRLEWQERIDEQQRSGWWHQSWADQRGKSPSGGWIRLGDWPHPANPDRPADVIALHVDPWKSVPHLHPKLRENERVSAVEGSLFLEYGIALKPTVRLAYLSSHEILDGIVRFGGEGHLARVSCVGIPTLLSRLLAQELTAPFALITPGLWGGPKLSIREPIDTTIPRGHFPWRREGKAPGILTERPRPWRYRLGAGSHDRSPWPGERPGRRRLSRGRWALPAGSCYQVAGDPLRPWAEWPERWFPEEGFSFKQLGTALSLPIS